MRLRRALWAALLPAAALTGCLFDDTVPPGTTLLCLTDAECPSPLACDEASHVCTSGAIIGLHVTDVRAEPAITNGDVARLIITADGDLDEAVAPVVSLIPSVPYTLESTSGRTQTVLVTLTSVEAGYVLCTSVVATGASGVVASLATSTSIAIDRVAPTLLNAALVEPPEGAVYADVTGFDVIRVRGIANEPLAAASVTGAGVSGACTVGEAGQALQCDLVLVAGEAQNGASALEITLRDVAGNVAVVQGPSVVVDAAAPAVDAATVSLALRTRGRVDDVLTPLGDATLRFVVDEDLLVPATVMVRGLDELFTIDPSTVGRSVVMTLGPHARTPGTYTLEAHLADRFGHAAVVVLPVTLTVGTSSGGCPPAPTAVCVDEDGDGAAARDGACTDGTDTADLDPTTHPGAREIPGDGIDNDGFGGDTPIDETTGVFVDAQVGDDGAPGTRSAPVRTLDVAAGLLAGRGYLFLADRAASYTAGGPVTAEGIVGGLSPGTFAPVAGARANVIADATAALLVRVASAAHIDAATVVDAHLQSLDAGTDDLEIVDSRIEELECFYRGVRAVRSTLGTARFDFDATFSFVQSRVENGLSVIEATGTLVSCGVTGLIVIEDRGALTAFHSTLRAEQGVLVDIRSGAFAATSSILLRVGAGPLISVYSQLGLPPVALHDCIFVAATDAVFLDQYSGSTFGFVDWVADSGQEPTGTSVEAVQFSSTYHLAGSAAARDRDTDAALFGAPPSIAVDVDGECRFADGSADIGADEFYSAP